MTFWRDMIVCQKRAETESTGISLLWRVELSFWIVRIELLEETKINDIYLAFMVIVLPKTQMKFNDIWELKTLNDYI